MVAGAEGANTELSCANVLPVRIQRVFNRTTLNVLQAVVILHHGITVIRTTLVLGPGKDFFRSAGNFLTGKFLTTAQANFDIFLPPNLLSAGKF